MAPESNSLNENADCPHVGLVKQEALIDSTDDGNKITRHPRWTRDETLILIQGKKVIEDGVRGGRRSTSTFGSCQVEPKWDSVSSYCKQRGVKRGPVQCRKRWGNLLTDYKKIKRWESQIKEEAESFWMMRNDIRREKKLASFFDKEIYNALDGMTFSATTFPLPLVAVRANANDTDGVKAEVEEEDGDEEETPVAVFDSHRHATAEDGLFSDFEHSEQEESGCSPEYETVSGTVKGKQPGSANMWKESISEEERKRRRLSLDGQEDASNLGNQLVKVLEMNSDKLNAHLEAQNINCQLDRDQRKEHTDSLVAALSKVTDALVRIADKL
ncbi:hypothetical protein RGQ29_004593 [Quercus rubra]|uniref:Myb-like domain-containing protein n=1 Tax=Quercus rubra TaxID=3512 RepID=A0AAN7EF42_QUERU|nr:hypothetical protein RGQ29_004593 [Quercus rubra]